jgi:hypothetical protein
MESCDNCVHALASADAHPCCDCDSGEEYKPKTEAPKDTADKAKKVWCVTAKPQSTLMFSSDSGFWNPNQWTVADNAGVLNMQKHLNDMHDHMFANLLIRGNWKELPMEKMQAIVRAYLEENELVEDFMGFVESYDAEQRIAKRKVELLGEDPEEEEEEE